jgi:hypothetical protein
MNIFKYQTNITDFRFKTINSTWSIMRRAWRWHVAAVSGSPR